MLTLNELTYRLGPRLLIDNATIALPNGARCGLVGRNGCGKSTLFRLLLGEIAAESGTFALPRGAKMGHVAQEAPGGPVTLLDYVLAADTERTALLAEAETATDALRISDIQTRLYDIGAHAAPARAAAILAGLGFDAEAQARPCSDFSGGWRMRVSLAAMLFLEPDMLLLDEPTNYLDIEGAIWLKSHLKRYPNTLLIVSHDKDFLNEVCDNILHLDRGKMTLYRGNYSTFAKERAEKQMQLEREAGKVAAQREHLQAFIDRFKAKASKAKQAQSRVKQLEKLGPVVTYAHEESAKLFLPNPEKQLAPPIVSMDNCAIGYGDRTVLRNLNLFISDDDRIGLLGQNGNGKSTLVKFIAGRMEPQHGSVTRAPKIKVAYFAQHQLDELSEKDTPYILVRRKLPQAGEAQVRSKAAQLGFGFDKADTPIEKLSGGEKARLLLGLAAFDGPHLLILDEPTNHLDIPMREALVEALAEYKGAVIIVSHDRAILDASCDRLLLVADGQVKTFDGDLDDYEALIVSGRSSKDDKPREEGKAGASSSADARAQKAERRANLKPLRDKAALLEAQIEKYQGILARTDIALANPELFTKYPDRAKQIVKDRAQLVKHIEATEELWLGVMAEIEAVQAA
ncbi:MAG: ATP-binding cassette subfamily F member [Beijerinckiaceae bacterium]|nr:MAG: ATP-binding cassette subfamily F member [Beijerinckiaceae bacterium]